MTKMEIRPTKSINPIRNGSYWSFFSQLSFVAVFEIHKIKWKQIDINWSHSKLFMEQTFQTIQPTKNEDNYH